MEERNEVLTNEIENEVTFEVTEIAEESESGSGTGRVIGTLFLLGAAVVGGVAWKNKEKIKQHRIARLKKKLAKLEGEDETVVDEEDVEFEEVVVDAEDDNK